MREHDALRRGRRARRELHERDVVERRRRVGVAAAAHRASRAPGRAADRDTTHAALRSPADEPRVVTTARAPAARRRPAVDLEVARKLAGRGRRIERCRNRGRPSRRRTVPSGTARRRGRRARPGRRGADPRSRSAARRREAPSAGSRRTSAAFSTPSTRTCSRRRVVRHRRAPAAACEAVHQLVGRSSTSARHLGHDLCDRPRGRHVVERNRDVEPILQFRDDLEHLQRVEAEVGHQIAVQRRLDRATAHVLEHVDHTLFNLCGSRLWHR